MARSSYDRPARTDRAIFLVGTWLPSGRSSRTTFPSKTTPLAQKGASALTAFWASRCNTSSRDRPSLTARRTHTDGSSNPRATAATKASTYDLLKIGTLRRNARGIRVVGKHPTDRARGRTLGIPFQNPVSEPVLKAITMRTPR